MFLYKLHCGGYNIAAKRISQTMIVH